jgi:hypothetical protein
MLVEVDEFCAVFACCDEKRTVEEQLGNMLGTYGTDPRTAPSPRSIKVLSVEVEYVLPVRWLSLGNLRLAATCFHGVALELTPR